MIQVLEGKGVGSGKSYFVCEMLIKHFSQGGTAFVSESFRIKWDELKKYMLKRYGLHVEDDQFRAVSGDDIMRLHEKTAGGTDDNPVLLVVDEAQDHLNARDWADKSKKDLFKWACQSRHDNNDVLFVSQAAANIDKQIRRLATYTWSVRNLNTFPIPGLGKVGNVIRFLTLGQSHGIVFARTLLDWDGRTQLERKLVFADPGVWNCYESKSMKQSHKRLGDPIKKKQLKKDITKRPMLRIIIPLGLIMLAIGIYRVATKGIIPKPEPKKTAIVQEAQKSGETRLLPGGTNSPTPKPLYVVIRDKMLARSNGFLKTVNHGIFQPGEISSLGMCEAVKGRAARVKSPTGEIIFILAEDWTTPPKELLEQKKVDRPIVIAPNPAPSPLTLAPSRN